MISKTAFVALTLPVVLGGCTSTGMSPLIEDQHLGEAKARTMAAQIIDPAPQYDYLDPPTSGEHAAQAIDRYRRGAVKQPERVSSTASSGPN